jgi:hypothetical protein
MGNSTDNQRTTPILERGIPLPLTGRARWRLDELKPSDSVFYPGMYSMAEISSVIRRLRNKGWRFVSRAAEVDGVRGLRVWRVE